MQYQAASPNDQPSKQGTELQGNARESGHAGAANPWAWVVALVSTLFAAVAIVALVIQLGNDKVEEPTATQGFAPTVAPSQAGESATPSAPGEMVTPVPVVTGAPADDVETVPTSSSEVVIEEAVVDEYGTVAVSGYSTEAGLTEDDIQALITYAGEVIGQIPVVTSGQNFYVQWKPGTLGPQVNLRELGKGGIAGELGKYKLDLTDKRHPSSPASIGFKPKQRQLPGRPGGGIRRQALNTSWSLAAY